MNESNEAKLHFLDYWRVIKVRLGLILLAFFLVMVTAGVTTYFLPREYLSKVKMEVKQDNSGPISIMGSTQQRSYDPQFVATQFQILQTTEILYPVIQRLDLSKEFSPLGQQLTQQQTYMRLRRAMQLQEVRNTGLIEIGVYHTKPEIAANIANMIAVVYQEKRRADLDRNVGRSLEQLQEEVTKQRKVVEQANELAAKIRLRDNINDSEVDKDSLQGGGSERKMQSDEQKVNEQRLLVAQYEVQIKTIERLKPEQLVEVLRTLKIEDQTVQKTLPLLQDARAELARLLNSGLGENHPRVRALAAQREVYEQTLSEQLESIRRAQTAGLEVARATLAELERQLGESRLAQIQDKSKMGEYLEAKNKYLNARKVLESAELTLSSERLKKGIDPDPAKIWEKAEVAQGPSKPNVPAYMALAALVGLVVGVGLAFFIEYLDTSVKTLDDVERYLQIPVLAVIPKNISVLMKAQGDTADAEAYRILRANIEFNKPHREANTFTLISGGPGEGKSTTMNNLAYTCARGGYNVLVVDADLRRPTQHTFFDEDNSFGLTDYLTGKADIEEITKVTKIDNLSFIPSGHLPSDSVGILNSQRMTEMISKVKQQYDLVFFDSPPILGVSDGSVLASEVDITIMVVQHRRFPRAMLQRVKQAVLNVGGRLIGVVLNNVDAKHDDGYSYYNAYNEYYGARAGAGADGARREGALPPVGVPGPAPSAPAGTPAGRPRTVATREDY